MKTRMKLVTECHDSCGETRTKKITAEEMVLWSMVRAWQALSLAHDGMRGSMCSSGITEMFPELDANTRSVMELAERANEHLVGKWGWNKWDLRTIWTLDEE